MNQDGSIDLFDLVIVAGSLGDDVEVSVQPEERTIEVINRGENREDSSSDRYWYGHRYPPMWFVLSVGVSVERIL